MRSFVSFFYKVCAFKHVQKLFALLRLLGRRPNFFWFNFSLGRVGKAPLTVAIERGFENCVEALLIAGANANFPIEVYAYMHNSKKSPLMLATSLGFQRGVELLLKFGADPNVRHDDLDQDYAIQLAADKPEIRAILLAAGAHFHAPRPPPDLNQACQIL